MDQLGEKPEGYRATQMFKITVGYDPPTHRLRDIQNSTSTHFKFIEHTQDGGTLYQVSALNRKAISSAKTMVYSSAYNHRRVITERVPVTKVDHELLVSKNELPAIQRESEVKYINFEVTGNSDGGQIAEFCGSVESVAKGKQLLNEKLEFLRLEALELEGKGSSGSGEKK